MAEPSDPADIDPSTPGDALALAQALEAAGDLTGALEVYGAALELPGDLSGVQAGMGRLALRVGGYQLAERLLATVVATGQEDAETIASLAVAQMRQLGFDRAQATLTAALETSPGEAVLWSTLGQLLCAQGRHAQSVVFFEEALRLGARTAPTLVGLAEAQFYTGGEAKAAIDLSEEGVRVATPMEAPAVAARHARLLLAAGRLADGWDAFARAPEAEVKIAAPHWTPGAPVRGRVVFLGEADVADDLLMAHAIPAIVAGTPAILAVDPSWEALARRSFPQTLVVPRLTRPGQPPKVAADLDSPHVHNAELVGAWAPLRAMMPRLRGRAKDFARAAAYLKPDPDRVAHWRQRLAALGPGPKVGVLWRAPGEDLDTAWQASPPTALGEPLSIPGLHLVSLKQGGALGEANWLRSTLGLAMEEFFELRRNDLDDLAALTLALDVVVGPPGIETYLAAASGAQTWFLSTPRHWAMLGTEGYPWFPNARVISADGPGEWDGAMSELGEALAGLAAR